MTTLSVSEKKAIESKVDAYRERLTKKAKAAIAVAEANGVREIIDTIFNDHLGKAIPLPVLVALTIQRVNVTPQNYNQMSRDVERYIKLVTNRTWLRITSGKSGGVRRIKDIPKKK
jgi:hypothetical protein